MINGMKMLSDLDGMEDLFWVTQWETFWKVIVSSSERIKKLLDESQTNNPVGEAWRYIRLKGGPSYQNQGMSMCECGWEKFID
jgi:hypothetical protein